MKSVFLFVFLFWVGRLFAQTNIAAADARIQYFGRWVVSPQGFAEADWPGVYLRLVFQGTGVSVRIQGTQIFEAVIDGERRKPFVTDDSNRVYPIAQGLANERHTLLLYKRSESQVNAFRILGLEFPKGSTLLDPPARPQRRIEYIGDSYTLGYGMEAPGRDPNGLDEDSLILWTTNAAQNFGALVARSLGAEYQINAFSGRGLVRNINGIAPDRPFGYFYDYMLMSARNTNQESPLWDFQKWHPQVIVIGLGINDFQGTAPPADTNLFIKAYSSFLDTLRSRHPSAKFVLCGTQVWPNDYLIPSIKKLQESEMARGKTDIVIFEYGAEKNGLWWHPDTNDHQNIARDLRPIIARLGGWLSR